MRKFALGLLLLFLISGCTTAPVRFTNEEIKGFPIEIQEKIIKGEVALGMTTQQVRYAWGSPNSIRVLEPMDGKQREEWIYTTAGIFEQRRLFFLDGKLYYVIPDSEKTIKQE
ncbi:MAG: hypothetical protein N3A59_03840 [Thermodesulfovibrionales bacterium]|nr:hypothetical protein [Thermodesulfovibrionales bacterium]